MERGDALFLQSRFILLNGRMGRTKGVSSTKEKTGQEVELACICKFYWLPIKGNFSGCFFGVPCCSLQDGGGGLFEMFLFAAPTTSITLRPDPGPHSSQVAPGSFIHHGS